METFVLDTNIHNKPPIDPFVEKIPLRPLPEVRSAFMEAKTKDIKIDGYWNKVNESSDKLLGLMKKNLGEKYGEHTIDLYGDLVFGPFRLNYETFIRGNPTNYDKEANARIQHNIVHNIFHSYQENTPESYSENIYKILEMHHDLINSSSIIYSDLLDKFWSGVKSEIAVIKVLSERGFDIILPNYTEEPNDEGMTQEVYDWDVKRGIDLIAAKHGQVYLLDAKGKSLVNPFGSEDNSVRDFVSVFPPRDRSNKTKQFDSLPESVQNIIDNYSPNRNWRQGTVIVPTNKDYLTPFNKFMTYQDSKKQSLNRFAQFCDRSLSDQLVHGVLRLQVF